VVSRAGDDLAARVLARHWGLAAAPQRVEVGVNKLTWRAGARWLSAVPASAAAAVRREHRLLLALRDRSFPYAAPYPVAGDRGTLAEEAGWAWWLTDNLPGRAPDEHSLGPILAAAAGLAGVHASLRSVPEDLAVMRDDSRALFERGVDLAASPAIGLDPADLGRLRSAADAVRAGWPRLDAAPRQIIHGDPAHPNLRMAPPPPGRLTGLLDWESCRHDLPIADLSRVGQTVLYRLGPPDPAPVLGRVLRAYHRAGGAEFSLADFLVAIIMAKFESIAHHGGRYLSGAGPRRRVAAQPGNIARAMALLDAIPASGAAR
jgi:Ser/Thr protein kinase RdoA (MazF antagonist)